MSRLQAQELTRVRLQTHFFLVGLSILALTGCYKEGNATEATTDGSGTIKPAQRAESSETEQTTTKDNSTTPEKAGVTAKQDEPGTVTTHQQVDDVISHHDAEKAELTAAKLPVFIPAVFRVKPEGVAIRKPETLEEKRSATISAAITAAMADLDESDEPHPAVVHVVHFEQAAQPAPQESRVETIEYGEPLDRIATVSERTVWTESSSKTRSREEPRVIVTEVVSSGETSRSSRTTSYTVYQESSSTQCFTGG